MSRAWLSLHSCCRPLLAIHAGLRPCKSRYFNGCKYLEPIIHVYELALEQAGASYFMH